MGREEATFTFANDVNAVPRIRAFVSHWLAEHHIPASIHSEFMLAVAEALNNACQHTSPAARAVHVSCRHDEGEIQVAVTDHGDGFLVDPVLGEPTLYEEGGRGLFLMTRLADSVHVAHGSDGTRVTLTRAIPSA